MNRLDAILLGFCAAAFLYLLLMGLLFGLGVVE